MNEVLGNHLQGAIIYLQTSLNFRGYSGETLASYGFKNCLSQVKMITEVLNEQDRRDCT
jgi:hypothetical protein